MDIIMERCASACASSSWLGMYSCLLAVTAAVVLLCVPMVTMMMKKLPEIKGDDNMDGGNNISKARGKVYKVVPMRGPWAIPIIGSVEAMRLRRRWHETLAELGERYGQILLVRLGARPVVLVSSREMARQVLVAQDAELGQRPAGEAVRRLFYGGTTLATMPQGPHWRDMRRFYVQELLHPSRLHALHHIRRHEVSSMLLAIAAAAAPHDDNHNVASVNLSQHLSRIPLTILLRMVMNRSLLLDSIVNKTNRGIELANQLRRNTGKLHDLWVSSTIGDFVPCLKWMDRNTHKYMDALHKSIDAVIEEVITHRRTDHKQSKPSDTAAEDFLDLLLTRTFNEGGPLNDAQIKGVIQDVLAAGSDVTTGVLEWAMTELLCKPPVLEKLHEELDQVVGRSRRVEEADIPNLTYLQAVVKEVYRLHPPAPVVARQAPSDRECTLAAPAGDGDDQSDVYLYAIPKGAVVWVNVRAIGRDGRLWKDPESFHPERFVGSSLDVRGQDMELLPFGAGRRACVGMNLGLAVVYLTIASLVQAFDWSLSIKSSDDAPLKGRGPFLRKAQPLMAFAKPRMPLSTIDNAS